MASEGSSQLPSEEKDSEKVESSTKDTVANIITSATPEVDDDRGDDLIIDEQNEEKSDGESDEKEFEPTIDMMMNDFDDEQTMEEEEANEDQEDEQDELAALEQEQDMPIEELLKMYGAVPGGGDGGEQEDSKDKPEDEELQDNDENKEKVKEELSPMDEKMHLPSESNISEENVEVGSKDDPSGNKRRGSISPQPPMKKSKSELAQFYEAAVEGRALRSQGSGQPDEMEDEEYEEGEDSDFENKELSWKKTIMIGPSYQASVPSDLAAYGDTLPYENEDKLLWHPGQLESKDVEDYLSKSQEAVQTGGVGSLPLGAHVRDDEQALYLLLQCGYSSEEALRRRRMNAVPTADTMTLWSEEECRAFELGLRLYGKDFHMIQSQKVRTRSVGELVQFYYLWKKTERHDVFANNTRLEKKKYTLHPGTTDYMDRFIDEQDPSRDRSSSPNFYSLIYGGQDGRKGLTLHPGAKSSVSHGDSNGAEHAIETSNVPTSSVSSNSHSGLNTSPNVSTNGRVTESEKANTSTTVNE